MSQFPFLILNIAIYSDIDDCVGHTCQNGAVCVDGVAAYTCSCLPGFTDSSCNTSKLNLANQCYVH